MRMSRWLAVLVVAASVASAAADVRLEVREPSQVARNPAVITTGVPFARGTVSDAGKLVVSVDGKAVPGQFAPLAKWPDGSISWALLDTQAAVPAGGKVELAVSAGGGNPKPAQPVEVAESGDGVAVSTGPLRFSVSKTRGNIIESLSIAGQGRLSPGSRGLVLHTTDGKEVVAGPPTQITVEHAGPMRAVVCVRGRFPGVHNGLLGYTARLTAFAGGKHVKLHVWLENHGASGHFLPSSFDRRGEETSKNFEWFAFKGLAVELGLELGEKLTARCEDIESANGLKVLQLCLHSKTKKMGTAQGPFYTFEDFEYTISAGGEELKKGLRTDGVFSVKGSAGTLTAAVRDFWENYEKAIELDGTTLKVWLWPTQGRWPRPFYWIKYAIEKTVIDATQGDCYVLPGSVHKGHEMILDFSDRAPGEASAELSRPLTALASAEHYATTEAAPGLFAPPQVQTKDRDADANLAAWERMLRTVADRDSANGLFKARERSDYSQVSGHPCSTYWFGWMDFGEISLPAAGQTGLHYDWPRIVLHGAMRTSEPAFMELAVAMTRHRIDIDQFWSQRENVPFRGLQRRVGSTPSYHCSPLHSPIGPDDHWMSGIVLYYLMTGEAKALECANDAAAGLKSAWSWIEEKKPYWSPQRDVAANAQTIESFLAMYKLTAERQWLDDALAMFNKNIVPIWKQDGPFLHNPANQIRGQGYAREDMKYCYSIATFCELHHLTGDETVFKLLAEGCEKEFPDSFFEAPLFLADLYAYVGYKTGNKELLARAADAFASAFPESRNPPVALPGNSTWSQASAMMLRTGNVLKYSFWKSAPAGK